jgi:hypothetical protein
MATFIVEIRNSDNGWRWTRHQTFLGAHEALSRAREAATERSVDTGDQARVRTGAGDVVFGTRGHDHEARP